MENKSLRHHRVYSMLTGLLSECKDPEWVAYRVLEGILDYTKDLSDSETQNCLEKAKEIGEDLVFK